MIRAAILLASDKATKCEKPELATGPQVVPRHRLRVVWTPLLFQRGVFFRAGPWNDDYPEAALRLGKGPRRKVRSGPRKMRCFD